MATDIAEGESAWTPETVAVVGGGRWARVMVSELARIEPPIDSIRIITAHNQHGMLKWLAQENAGVPSAERIQISSSLEQILADSALDAVVIANMPAAHAATGRRVLNAGIPALIEKPLCPTAKEAAELIDLAAQVGVPLAVGHEMHFTSWVSYIAKMAINPLSIDVEWLESTSELRHAESKQPDWSVGVVADLFPHVLTIAQCVGRSSVCSVQGVDVSDSAAVIHFDLGELAGRAHLVRGANRSRRRCVIGQADGSRIEVDFTSMPALITHGTDKVILDDEVPSVQAELRAFFASIAAGKKSPIRASAAMGIVAATEHAVSLVHAHTEHQFRDALRLPPGTALPADLAVALREHLLPRLLEEGLIADPKDTRSLDKWIAAAFGVAHTLATKPFDPMASILEELGLDIEAMRRLSRVIRDSRLFQQMITQGGTGRKYWTNTIIPLVQSGSIKAALDGTPTYPFRVGIYPGPSCMFKCSFCGRNYDARYDRALVAPGNTLMRQMFDQAPTDDPNRFYISGGLEPLTNPEIGDLICYGAARGFRLSMYTNGLMLTPRYLERQSGLWDLTTLRISLYGVDEHTTFAVTRKSNAFGQVIRNVEAFMRERDRRLADVRLGFNFVILPGCSEQVLKIAELIADLNRRAGGRQVDFLTLREDYSVPSHSGIQRSERAALMSVFERLEERRQKPDLDQLQVDYGYSLQALVDGAIGRPLEMVDFTEMRAKAYPQISVVVDLQGDVYAYREAGFIDRPGADRYILGRMTPEQSLDAVVRQFVEAGNCFESRPGDSSYFDIFDHVVTALLNQAERDSSTGIPFAAGPVVGRDLFDTAVNEVVTLAHPTLAVS